MPNTRTRLTLFVLVLLAMVLFAAPAQASTKFTFQNWWDDLVGWQLSYGYGCGDPDFIIKNWSDAYCEEEDNRYFDAYGCSFRASHASNFNYYAWTSADRRYPGDITDYEWGSLFDSSKAYINTVPSVAFEGCYGCRFEVYRKNQKCYYYRDGIPYGGVPWVYYDSCPAQPYYLNLTSSGGVHSNWDDLIIGGDDPYIVGTIPHNWYIAKDLLDPTLSGLYDSSGNQVYSTVMHVSWGIGLQGNSYTEPGKAVGNYSIRLTHISTNDVVANYNLDDSIYHVGNYGNKTEVDIDTYFFDADAPYGYYQAGLFRGDSLLTWDWVMYTSNGATVEWDHDTYSQGDLARVTTTVLGGYWDTLTYDYEGRVFNIYGETQDTWTVTSASENHYIDLQGMATGQYVAAIIATKKTDGTEYWLGYDVMTLQDTAIVSGYVKSATTGLPIAGATVAFNQGLEWHNTTSDGTGQYNLSNIEVSQEVVLHAIKAGYSFESWNWTPMIARRYSINLTMYPDAVAGFNGTAAAIQGISALSPYHEPLPDSLVVIYNGSWSDQNWTTGTGYYLFDNLVDNGTYYVNGTKGGYVPSPLYTVETGWLGNVTNKTVLLSDYYDLGVTAKDAETDATILDSVAVELRQSGSTIAAGTTTTGTWSTTQPYGIYDLLVSSSGYTSQTRTIALDSDQNLTFYLLKPSEGGGSGIHYAPHQVKFVVRDMWGNPIPDVNVTATYLESSGPLAWLTDWLGLSSSTTPQSVTLEGTTGTDGVISFMMVESLKYRVHAYKSGVIDVSMDIYPKDDYYILWSTAQGTSQFYEHEYNELEEITFNASYAEINSTYGYITGNYDDRLKRTTSVTMWVNWSDTFNGTEHFASSLYTVAGDSNVTHTFSIQNHRGHSYLIRLNATHPDFGYINRIAAATFPDGPVNVGFPESWHLYIAMFCLLFVALIIPASGVQSGIIIWCGVGWLFWGIGWLRDLAPEPVPMIVMSFATVIAVFYSFSVKHKQTGG